jgi:hypothetical protein
MNASFVWPHLSQSRVLEANLVSAKRRICRRDVSWAGLPFPRRRAHLATPVARVGFKYSRYINLNLVGSNLAAEMNNGLCHTRASSRRDADPCRHLDVLHGIPSTSMAALGMSVGALFVYFVLDE